MGSGHRSVPRPARALVGALLAVGMSFLPAFSAAAAQKIPVCEGFTPASPCKLEKPQVNWFWSTNSKVTVCVPPPEGSPDNVPGACGPISGTGGVFGNASGTLSPITSGHMGVSLKNGEPDMRTYIKVDAGLIPPTADLTSLVLTMNVSLPSEEHNQRHSESGGKLPATLGDARATIMACAVTQPWANMAVDGGDPTFVTRVDQDKVDPTDPDPNDGVVTQRVEPTSDCGLNVTGKRASDGQTWTFDLTPIAEVWREGKIFNEGVVLMPVATGPAQTWTVEFHGHALTVEPTAGSATDEPTVWVKKNEASYAIAEFIGGDPVLPPPPPPAPIGPEIGGGLPSFGNDVPQPVTEPPPPPTQPQPTVTTPVASPNPAFWWAMFPLGALGLGLYSSAVGADPLADTTRSGNRVARLLRRRRLGGIEPSPEEAGQA